MSSFFAMGFVTCALALAAALGLTPPALGRSSRHDGRPGNFDSKLIVNGSKRIYRLHVPAAPASGTSIPLVLVFHGGMENGAVISKITGMDKVADRENFIVAYPYGSGRLKRKLLMWNAFDCCGYAIAKNIDDVAFVSALIEKLAGQYKIDRNRVYACGYSNGAMFALRLASELSDKVAAVVSVGGSMSGKEKEPSSPVSVLMIHGTDDRHVPYNGGTGKWAKVGYPVNKEPVSYAVDFWRKADGCLLSPQVTEQKDLRIESYSGGKQGAEVKLITLKGARHTWPGGKQSLIYTDKPFNGINATQECWKFFSEHAKNQGT